MWTDSDSARSCEWNGSEPGISLPIAIYLTFADPQRVTNEYLWRAGGEHRSNERAGGTSEQWRSCEKEGERDSLNSCTRPLAGQRRNNVDTKRPVDRGVFLHMDLLGSRESNAEGSLRKDLGRRLQKCVFAVLQTPAQFSTPIQ